MMLKPKTVECKICGRKYRTWPNLKRHLETVHPRRRARETFEEREMNRHVAFFTEEEK